MNNKTSKEELQYWDKILDEYETSIGLSEYSASVISSQEINTYTSMSRDEIEKLNPEDCAQISYRLSPVECRCHYPEPAAEHNARAGPRHSSGHSVRQSQYSQLRSGGFLHRAWHPSH